MTRQGKADNDIQSFHNQLTTLIAVVHYRKNTTGIIINENYATCYGSYLVAVKMQLTPKPLFSID